MDKRDKYILRDIYIIYGEEAVFNPKKLRAYLLDMRVSKKTINLLVDISRIEYFSKFAEEIINDPTAREKLVYSTENEYAFDKGAVEYGADCWAYALTGTGSADNTENPGSAPISGETVTKSTEPHDDDIWPEEKAELVAAALRELMRDGI